MSVPKLPVLVQRIEDCVPIGIDGLSEVSVS